jgi:tubulin-specific chaperone E
VFSISYLKPLHLYFCLSFAELLSKKLSRIMNPSETVIGCRVVDGDGFKATVKYIGPVVGAKNAEEVWFGLEWDVPSRGKHDGSSIDSAGCLHRYFECASGSGSFIKPNKVTGGRTLLEALTERYVSLDAPTISEPDATLPNVFVGTFKGNQKSVEFVGEEKIRYVFVVHGDIVLL